MFKFDQHLVKVKNASLVYENHGKESHVTGMKIQFATTVAQDVIDVFSKDLRHVMFRGQKANDQMDIEFDNDGLVIVRHPKLKPFVWDEVFIGYEAIIGAPGLGFNDPVVLVDVKLDGISMRPLEGGSVELSASIYCHPQGEELAMLAAMVKDEAELTLTPPTHVATAGENLLDDEDEEDDEAAAAEADQLEDAAAGDLEDAA